MEIREERILKHLKNKEWLSSKELFDEIEADYSYATLKRVLTKLIDENYITVKGRGKGTKYAVSPVYEVVRPIDIEQYYEQEIDERNIKTNYNSSVVTEVLATNKVFTKSEMSKLTALQKIFENNLAKLSETVYKKEMERLAIDLSWKSSQIEGNTYSLLETERLLREKETAQGKTKEEAVMLLNHKEAIDFIVENPDYLHPLTVARIEDIHSMLIKELAVERNIRKRRVGISGTNYRPLDNEFQILEALEDTCQIINNKRNIFEKALLALVLVSYIQPFADGNKRTARIVSNALLMNAHYCPLSFRTVDSIEFKKAMLLFYEQNNISAMKEIFIHQYEFAVNTYF